ncbi:hypothetical protein HHK36_012117 [Tetracentron sinense]|uniref:Uncharacterized protein n=1 Tax=Tetracentron sinense TaxID=13715 RepID=A0A834Z8T3_TETSI|nr:hypothetical protein HHK36_012117 [Tetracentron sinense]
MSENERSKDGGGDDEEVIHREGPKKQRGYGRELRKAKHVVLFPFRKVNKLYRRKNSSASPGKGGGCYPSFMQPLNSDSSVSASETLYSSTFEEDSDSKGVVMDHFLSDTRNRSTTLVAPSLSLLRFDTTIPYGLKDAQSIAHDLCKYNTTPAEVAADKLTS